MPPVTSETVGEIFKGLCWYALAYVIGAVVLGLGVAAIYAQPQPLPPYFPWFFEDHIGVTCFLSLIVCPVVGAIAVAAFLAFCASGGW